LMTAVETLRRRQKVLIDTDQLAGRRHLYFAEPAVPGLPRLSTLPVQDSP
jgi:hypothetical protein